MQEKLKILYVCKKCGMTHFTLRKPIYCKECSRKMELGIPIKIWQC